MKLREFQMKGRWHNWHNLDEGFIPDSWDPTMVSSSPNNDAGMVYNSFIQKWQSKNEMKAYLASRPVHIEPVREKKVKPASPRREPQVKPWLEDEEFMNFFRRRDQHEGKITLVLANGKKIVKTS